MKLELLAPAGSLNKLKVAFRYGADAVYVGGKKFSLRAYAGNFELDELAEGVKYAHERGKKLYVTVNIFPKNSDFEEAERYFKYLQDIGVDAVLITDPGFFSLCKRVAPNLPIHISTQANNLNKYTVEFWKNQGAERVVLARELRLEEVKEIHEFTPDVELEAFVHGAMCISYSGRCLLSNYLSTRDGNRGECVQSCRWKYKITESSREGNPLEMEEDDRGTYILNSKDLNMLTHIDKLVDSGIISFKIEGRMKSEYYLATVINAYRRAIDEYVLRGKIENLETYLGELNKITHRTYTEAYSFGKNDSTVSYSDDQDGGTHEFIAYVMDYENGVAKIEMRNRFYKGDTLEILSPNASFNKKFVVDKVINEKGGIVEDAKFVQEILYMDVPFEVQEGDILRRARK